MNKLVHITRTSDLLPLWPFFAESVEPLQESGRCPELTLTALAKMTLGAADMRPTEGAVFVLVSENNKPLAYSVCLNNTDIVGPVKLLLWAVYSNSKCASALKQTIDGISAWARRYGYDEIQAFRRRLNGAAERMEKKLGFEAVAVEMRIKL